MIRAISVTALFQFLDEISHLSDMTRSARRNIGALTTKRVEVFPKCINVLRRVLVERLPGLFGLSDDAIIHVGQVHHGSYAQAFELQVAPNQIRGDGRTKITDMAVIPDRRPAVVKLRLAL